MFGLIKCWNYPRAWDRSPFFSSQSPPCLRFESSTPFPWSIPCAVSHCASTDSVLLRPPPFYKRKLYQENWMWHCWSKSWDEYVGGFNVCSAVQMPTPTCPHSMQHSVQLLQQIQPAGHWKSAKLSRCHNFELSLMINDHGYWSSRYADK